MNDEILVSVFCIAHNHEKYIRRCLDGFVSQEAPFRYEVLVHDDASTDRTAEIIREYERKYPDIIKPIYQKENQYSKGVKIAKTFLVPKAKGTYVAFCEGDDYWCDKTKLAKQAAIMEQNPSCNLCVHRVDMITEDGKIIGHTMPDFDTQTGIIDSDTFIEIELKCHRYHTSSFFIRKTAYRQFISRYPNFYTVASVGDEPMLLYFATTGNVAYIDDIMSHYRIGSIGGWGQSAKYNYKILQRRSCGEIAMLEAFDAYTNGKYSDAVTQRVLHARFKQATVSYPFRQPFQKEFRTIYKSLPLQRKLKMILLALFPNVIPKILIAHSK